MKYKDCFDRGKESLEGGRHYRGRFGCQISAGICLRHGSQYPFAHPDKEVSEEETSRYEELIGKRKDRIPLQQLTGHQEFMGLDFCINESVLIPRQDTEILVEEAMKELHDGMRVLDMCTGSAVF